MRSMRVVSATKTPSEEGMVASATFELMVPPTLCNPMDRMHGGAMVRYQSIMRRQVCEVWLTFPIFQCQATLADMGMLRRFVTI